MINVDARIENADWPKRGAPRMAYSPDQARDDQGQWTDEGAGGAAWFAKLERLSGPLGTNPGGLYRDPRGGKWYVKRYADPAQAAGEQAANAVYRAVGVAVPDSALGEGGAFATKWLEGGEVLAKAGLTKANANQILEGFAADVLLVNWDAVGTGHDNILLRGGRAIRIDQGGTLLHRAQGALKPEAALHGAGEWESLRTQNPWYAKVFAAAGVKSADAIPGVIAQIDAIARARPAAGWASLVAEAAPAAPKGYAAKAGAVLEERQKALEKIRERLAGTRALGEASLRTAYPGQAHEPGGTTEGGQFTGPKDVSHGSPVKAKSKPATEQQIKQAVAMKQAGASYAQIKDATGLNEKQAATIVFKHNKKQAEVAKALAKGNTPEGQEPLTKADVVIEKKKEEPAAGAAVAAKAESLGYEWKAKTSGPNKGKYAWFQGGAQVSAFGEKGEKGEKAATINYGAGPKAKPAAPAAKPDKYAATTPVEKGAAPAPSDWPIGDGVTRKMGSKYEYAVISAGQGWVNGLNTTEKSAIQQYTGSGSSSINSELRSGGKVTGKAAVIDQALAKAPKPPPPELVWRGVSGGSQLFSGLGPGDVVTLKGFQSSSIDPNTAAGWGSSGHVFEIKPARGAYVKPISNHPGEHEYLLPHGAKYTVRGIVDVKLSAYSSRKVIQLEMQP